MEIRKVINSIKQHRYGQLNSKIISIHKNNPLNPGFGLNLARKRQIQPECQDCLLCKAKSPDQTDKRRFCQE